MSAPTPLHTTRRGFLRLAGAGAAFSGLAGLRTVPAAAAEGETPAGFFSPGEREILTQVAERIVDGGEGGAPAVRDTGTVLTIDALCSSLDPALTGPLPALLQAVEYGPFVFQLRFQRFTQMTAADQDASLAGWMSSRFALRRQAFQALRNLSFLGYYSQEETWPLIGYAGPLLRPRPDAA